MSKKTVNTFIEGIDRDTSIKKYKNTTVYDSVNFTLMHDRELSNQALISIEGSLMKANISGEGVFIKGHLNLRDFVILFVKTPSSGRIYKFLDLGGDIAEAGELTLIYEHADLFQTNDNEIIGVGRYESDTIQKIYFTDRETFFYHMNIIDDPLTNPLTGVNKLPLEAFEIVSDILYRDMEYTVQRGGNLRSGRIQYSYQLYNINGSETAFSPPSSLINLTEYDDDASDSMDYLGSKQDVAVNKSVRITIPIPENVTSKTFTRARVIAIHYESDVVLPQVRVIGEYDIKDLSNLIVTDTGQVISTFTLEEYRLIQQNIVPKTLESKDNILFAGNVEVDSFYISDSDFDARAFRFNPSGVCVLNQGDSGDSNNSELTLLAANVSNHTVPLQHACFNVFNDLSKDEHRITSIGSTTNYRYKPDGATLGGAGKFVSYEFVTVPKIIDTEPLRYSNVNPLLTYYGYPKLQVNVEAPFDNYASYRTSAELVGYQRDEIYAFAIVFYDKKGRKSFAKWIGDIRFPDNSTHPFITLDSGSNHTIANILGIKFEVTIPAGLQDIISGYQIVRCERRDSDKTIKAAGLYAYPYQKNRQNDEMCCVATVPTVADCKLQKIFAARVNQPSQAIVPANKDASQYLENFTSSQIPLTNKFVEFSSPDISFNKKLATSPSDIMEIVGYHNTLSCLGVEDRRGGNDSDNFAIIAADKYKGFGAYPSGYSMVNELPFSRVKPDLAKIFTQMESRNSPSYVFPGGYSYNKQTHNGRTSEKHFGLRGTHLFASLQPNNSFYLPDEYAGLSGGAYDFRVMYGYYRTNPAKGIYNGTDFSSRQGRTYYKASKFIRLGEDTTTIPTVNVETIEIPIGEGLAIPEQALVVFENMLPGGDVSWNVGINLPAATIQDTTFTIRWRAYREDSPSAVQEFGANLVVPNGQLGATMFVYEMIESVETENWIIEEQWIEAINPTNQYLVTGELLSGSTSSYQTVVTEGTVTVPGIVVFGGDTYIDYHIDYRSIWDNSRLDGRHSIKSIVFYPVESTINLALRLDDIQKNINWHAHGYSSEEINGLPPLENAPKYHLQEKLSSGINLFGDDYPVDFGDMYKYNSAYSAMDKTDIFIPEPFDFKQVTNYDTRTYASDVKINGEYSDAWIRFKPNSYIDVDSHYGPLQRLLNVANRLMFFQPNGLGILSVNERALIEDNNVGKLTLGTGGILPRFDYLSFNTGISEYNSVVKADSTFYYVDSIRKRIYTHEGGDVPVSVLKGLNSILQNLNFDYVNTGFDPKFNRVYFTIDDQTFIFNEFYKAFTHRIQLVPVRYVTLKNNFYTVRNYGEEVILLYNDFDGVTYDDDGITPVLISDSELGAALFKHGVNTTGILDAYETTGESFVELIINPENGQKCTFTNLEFDMEVIDVDGKEVFQDTDIALNPSFQPIFETIKQVVFSNSYMTKTVDVVYGQTIKKIGKVWRMQIPLVPDRKVPTRTTRFVDSYIKVKIIFDNSTVNRLRLHDVITYYIPSIV